jgi:hypothetical protein
MGRYNRRLKGKVYCPECKKYYRNDECTHQPNFSGPGSFLEEWNVTCPKGHTWDDK